MKNCLSTLVVNAVYGTSGDDGESSQLFMRAAQALKSSTPAQYSPHTLAEVHTEWEGPKIGHDELVEKDGVMVYKQVRENPGALCMYPLAHR